MSHTNRALPCKTLLCGLILFMLAGCSGLNLGQGTTQEGTGTSQAYFPTKFRDFEVPNELQVDRSKTLFINTSSFNGGIVYLTGRLEVESLTDYFSQSMQKNGWKLSGEAHYKNVLLAFTKPGKNCLISLYEGELGTSTKVYAYITEDLGAGGAGDASGGGVGGGGGY